MLTCGAYVDDGDVVVRSAYSISSRLVGRLSRLRRHISKAPRKGYAVFDFSLTIYEVTARARVFVAALALPRYLRHTYQQRHSLSQISDHSVNSLFQNDYHSTNRLLQHGAHGYSYRTPPFFRVLSHLTSPCRSNSARTRRNEQSL
jgi:hypothetical protein